MPVEAGLIERGTFVLIPPPQLVDRSRSTYKARWRPSSEVFSRSNPPKSPSKSHRDLEGDLGNIEDAGFGLVRPSLNDPPTALVGFGNLISTRSRRVALV